MRQNSEEEILTPSPFLCILKYFLSTDFNDALLTKFLIQQHRGVNYLKEHDIFMSTTGHCLELKEFEPIFMKLQLNNTEMTGIDDFPLRIPPSPRTQWTKWVNLE